MSRALDKDVKEALKNGDHLEVFKDISGVLTRPSEQLYEIELMGQSTVLDASINYLQDENAIAIPKLRLVQAFIVARQMLLADIKGRLEGGDDVLMKATAVILLMDPEFLTAANARKRVVRRRLQDSDRLPCLTGEKQFVDSLLTSRLHRHTKSPTLWNHRRWLIHQYRACGHGGDVNVEQDLQNIIGIAGERHPKNYYAWCHARYLVNTLVLPADNSPEALRSIINIVKKWCFSHHDDISGWQFLLFLLQNHKTETTSTVQETLRLTEAFKWRNESVWYFLRYAFSSPNLPDQDRDDISRVRRVLWESAAEGSEERHTLEAFLAWTLS